MRSPLDRVRLFLRLGSWPVGIAGFGHALLTLPDIFLNGAFSPVDASVRAQMAQSNVVLADLVGAPANIWGAYVGFSISHGIGLGFLAVALLWLANRSDEVLRQALPLLRFALAMASIYLITAINFWFYGPTLGGLWAFGCLALACWTLGAESSDVDAHHRRLA